MYLTRNLVAWAVLLAILFVRSTRADGDNDNDSDGDGDGSGIPVSGSTNAGLGSSSSTAVGSTNPENGMKPLHVHPK